MESRQILQFGTVERPFFAVPHLSTVFFTVPALFSPVLDDFRQKREKKDRQIMEERERKERVPFQFLSRSRFFPFLSTHIPTAQHTGCADVSACGVRPNGDNG